MNPEISRKYVQRTIEQLLNTTVIEFSREEPEALLAQNSPSGPLKKFSLFTHVSQPLASLRRAAPFDQHPGLLASHFTSLLRPAGPLATHFSTYYAKVL